MLSGVLTASLDVQYLRVVGSAVVVEEWTVLLLILSPQHKHTVAHLKWPSLASRRKVQKLCVCRRILSGDSLIPSSTFIRASTVTRHHLNNQPLFRPFVRTNHHMSSFFVDAVLQWNKVPDSVCSLSSNLAFKSHIKKLFY